MQNLRERVTSAARLSNDGLANIHELAYDLPNFVWLIQTFPDLILVAGREEILQELNSLLQQHSRTNTQLLSYNTTFNFGEFYLSVLLFRTTCFTENPVIPALFMVHEHKLSSTHGRFVEILADKVPALNNSNCVLVTDGEASFDVLQERFVKLNKVFCWNHTLTAAKHWLRGHNASTSDIMVYVDHIRTLLHSSTLQSYKTSYTEFSK